jgi:hypothetical protein
MPFSSDVVAGDTILATDYNNLRKDTVNIVSGHDHDGANSKVLANLAVTNAMIANTTIQGAKLNANVADASTIEISGTTLIVKAGGLTGLHFPTTPRATGTWTGAITVTPAQGFYVVTMNTASQGTNIVEIKIGASWYGTGSGASGEHVLSFYADGTNLRVNVASFCVLYWLKY